MTQHSQNGEARYLLVKRDLYYRPDNRGYTGIKSKAGRYMASEADEASGVTAIHEDDAPMFAKGCWEDVKTDHLLSIITAHEKTIADLRQSLTAREPATADVGRDTVAFVQQWLMSGDHEPTKWERDFAAAIDARVIAASAADLAEHFCVTPLPDDVCADLCATVQGPGRYGTHLLTVDQATRVLSAALSRAAPSSEGEWVMPTPAEERAKLIAAYAGPVVSFDVAEPFYLASCDACGWVGSSGACSSDEADDVFCPRCFASGADCGKVAERIPAPSSGHAMAEGERAVTLADCPPGLFTFNGALCFKSEYTTTLENPRRFQCDAYVVESGEYFQGGTGGDVVARAQLLVRPVTTPPTVDKVAVETPVAWCSPGQLANLMYVDADGGVYLPIRKTTRGNFTMPLYAAPAPPDPGSGSDGWTEAGRRWLAEGAPL